jgi:hypothetical protein
VKRARLVPATLSALMLGFVSACAVTGVGVEGSVGYDGGYDGGYYEPYGYDYGGWGLGYRVAPSRCCEHREDHRDHPAERGHAGRAPAYHPAPAGRSAPSIPGRSRSH